MSVSREGQPPPSPSGQQMEQAPPTTGLAGSRVDAGATTESGPLGRIDAPRPTAVTGVPRPPLGAATGVVATGFVGLVACLVILGTIAEGVREQEAFALDAWATPFLHSISSPFLDGAMTALTTMGSGLVLVPLFAIVAAALVVRRRFGAAAFLTVGIVGAAIVDFVMKLIFQRPRPKLDYASVLPDYSFPSGHSMNGIVFYVGLALIAWSIFGRRVGLLAVAGAAILAIAIGVSRIYLGYHYLTDVVGGWTAGVAWLLIVGAAFRVRPTFSAWMVGHRGSGAPTTDRGGSPG